MKKVSTILICSIISLIMLSGCGEGENNPVSTSSSSPVSDVTNNSSISSTVKAESLPSADEVSFSAMLPDTKSVFPSGEITIIDEDGGSSYTFQVTGYGDGEYETYTEKCKELGFSDVQFDIKTDTNNKFEARSEDGKYYVSVQLLHETKVLNVTCAKRRNVG